MNFSAKALKMGFAMLCVLGTTACGDTSKEDSRSPSVTDKPKVTFVEMGSVNCIPCRAMKRVMDSLEVLYPKDLKIVFYDVWSDTGKRVASQYAIRSIPTQIFLDGSGFEFFRHEGYFPLEAVLKILQNQGVHQ
ncbi:MAG TPA: thioredoxin family protein [Fibrobacteraceae bacterium]|nr:thioredoxin family protein [Fibrobacteraceae bacterium]